MPEFWETITDTTTSLPGSPFTLDTVNFAGSCALARNGTDKKHTAIKAVIKMDTVLFRTICIVHQAAFQKS